MADPFADVVSRRMFVYDRLRLPNEHLRKVDGRAYNLRSAFDTSGLSMGYPAWNLLYYVCLCSVSRDRETVNMVETGTNCGFSTIVMAQVLHDLKLASKLQTVDIEPQAVELARTNVQLAGLSEHVDFHVGDSLAYLESYVQSVDRVDFAFLDGNHERDHVIGEFERLHPKLTGPSSTVYFDNTVDEGVAEALKAIQARFGGNLVEFPNCSWGPPGNAIWQNTRP